MVDIFYIENTKPLLPQQIVFILGLIGNDEIRKYERYKRWQDKQAYLLGKFLVIKFLNKYGYHNKLLSELSYTEFKRPFIKSANFDFNISHSGEFVICAFSNTQVIGIDIEQIQPVNFNDFSYILNKSDNERIKNAEDTYLAFFKIWSAKEAVLKAEGCGLVDDIFNLEINGDTAVFNKTTYYLKELSIHPDYPSFIASSSPINSINVEKVSFDDSM